MNKKLYKFTYGIMDAFCEIEVDFDVFTQEMATAVLEFFSWDYDKENDPIEEFMKKLALEVFYQGVQNLGVYGVQKEFESLEGWPRISGEIGITLKSLTNFEFIAEDLETEIEDL